MKNILVKTFLYICAFTAILQGIVFLLVYFNYFPVEKVVSFYSFITKSPYAYTIILILSITFLIFGFTLLLLAIFRKNTNIKTIEIEGASVTTEAIKDYVNQLLQQNPLLTDFKITINKKGKCTHINVATFFPDTASVVDVTKQIRETLRQEITKVFELPDFKINFKIKGLNLHKTDSELPVSTQDLAKEQVTEPEPEPGNQEDL